MESLALSDYVSVVNLLQSYVDALDRGDMEDLLAQFAPDAVWDYSPQEQWRGHDGLREFFSERFSVFAKTHHIVGAPRLRMGADGKLHSVAYFIASHQLADQSGYTLKGRYVDVIERVQGRWLITRRSLIAHMKEGTNRHYTFLERKTTPLAGAVSH